MGLPDACRHRAVEPDVVDQERLRVVERREHARDFLGDGRDLLVGGTLGRERRHADFERAARLEHLVAREAVQRRQKTQRLAAERRGTVGDEGAGAVPRLQHADRRRAIAGPRARSDG